MNELRILQNVIADILHSMHHLYRWIHLTQSYSKNKMTLPTISHYSSNDNLVLQLDYKYEREVGFKPKGFWISVDDNYGWVKWCRNSRYDAPQYRYNVELKKSANILSLDTAEKITQFTARYSVDVMTIAWNLLYAEYDGIIISPYQETSHFEHVWYNTWHCASGCIWNLECIEKLGRDMTYVYHSESDQTTSESDESED